MEISRNKRYPNGYRNVGNGKTMEKNTNQL